MNQHLSCFSFISVNKTAGNIVWIWCEYGVDIYFQLNDSQYLGTQWLGHRAGLLLLIEETAITLSYKTPVLCILSNHEGNQQCSVLSHLSNARSFVTWPLCSAMTHPCSSLQWPLPRSTFSHVTWHSALHLQGSDCPDFHHAVHCCILTITCIFGHKFFIRYMFYKYTLFTSIL